MNRLLLRSTKFKYVNSIQIFEIIGFDSCVFKSWKVMCYKTDFDT